MVRLLQPQEIEVHYLIPSIKRSIAIAMKESGIKQRRIADLLHTKEAAVSQYLNKKRGVSVQLDDPLLKEVKKSASRIKDTVTLISEMQRLLRLARLSGILCKVHKQYARIPQNCGPHLVDCFKQHDYQPTKL